MNPLSALYGAGVAIRNHLYDSGRLAQSRLQGPVISVGNISVGGTGKTPFTMMLGDLLLKRGISFDVLSRGYRRRSREVGVVDPAGSVSDFGDEPLLMARHFGDRAQVFVGADRYEAGLFAEKSFGPRLHLLDDGFQHRRLKRDFDIVLLAPNDLKDGLLPTGRLREPRSGLRRADAVVISPGMELSAFRLTGQRVWTVERDIVLPGPAEGVTKPLAFCGIARPERFFADLRRHRIYPVLEVPFSDHHSYSTRDLRELIQAAVSRGADSFITTEKDIANLGELASVLENSLPIVAVQVRVSLRDEEAAVTDLLATISRRLPEAFAS